MDWNISDSVEDVLPLQPCSHRSGVGELSPILPPCEKDNGGIMNNRNIAGDFVWIARPDTVFNFRGSYSSLEDDYDGKESEDR